MKSNSEVLVWGTSKYSLWELSQALRALRVSHSVDSPLQKKRKQVRLGFAQPKTVHLTSNLDGLVLDAVNLVSAALGALVDTNFKPFPDSDLETALKQILVEGTGIVPKRVKRDAANYVENLAKPSLLNKMQTEINRIQPYDLRKQVQGWTLDYFNHRLSIRAMMRLLERSSKTERLKPMFKEGIALREAVGLLKTKPIEIVEKETGFSSFELLYLTKAKRKD